MTFGARAAASGMLHLAVCFAALRAVWRRQRICLPLWCPRMPASPLLRVLSGLALLPLAALQAAAVEPALRAQPLSELATPRWLSAPAEVIAAQDSLLSAELALPVGKIWVEVGDQVKAGQPLLELDRRDPALQLRQAEARRSAAAAQRQLANQRLARGRELAQRQFTSADDLLALEAGAAAAEAEFEIAESAVAEAHRRLDKAVLKAPFDGEVSARMAQQGAIAAPGQPLLRLVQLGAEEVESKLPEALAGQLELSPELYLDTPGERLPLRLLRLTQSADPASRTRTARLRFVAVGLAPGRSGSLVWRAPGLSVPAELLVQRESGLGVFVLEQGRARFVAIPGALPGRSAELALPPATLVISQGQQRLRDGDPVAAAAASEP